MFFLSSLLKQNEKQDKVIKLTVGVGWLYTYHDYFHMFLMKRPTLGLLKQCFPTGNNSAIRRHLAISGNIFGFATWKVLLTNTGKD